MRGRSLEWFEEESMGKHKRVSSPIYAFFPSEVEGFDSLAELALDMRWSGIMRSCPW